MLVLTRKLGETLVIGDDIRVTVVAIKGNQVSLGVEAPLTVRVDREEVHQRKKAAAGESPKVAR